LFHFNIHVFFFLLNQCHLYFFILFISYSIHLFILTLSNVLNS
jgi:hypothetical protein